MFNALASYLLGAQTTTSSTDETDEFNNLRLTVVSDDDWLVVDRDDDERDSTGNSEVESTVSDDCDNNNTDNHHHLPCLLTRTSSVSSLPCTTVDESWYITPPPCFTSSGPIIMETSPLENLLIEHPSMSVYHQHSPRGTHYLRHNLETVPVLSLEKDEIPDPVDTPVQGRRPRGDQENLVVRRNRVDVIQQEEKQRLKTKQAQKVQIQKACQSLKRRYLERNNKAREVNGRNWRQRRGERSQGANRSYANNNRKC